MMALALPTMTAAPKTAVSNDAQDFAALVGVHQEMVFSIAYHFLRDRAAAEEIAQDVFLQLHSRQERLKSPEHILFWLRRVTVHRCIDHARRLRRRQEVPMDELPEITAPPAESDEWMNRHLRRLVASLPEKARMVVVLRYQEDLDPREIAALLKMPVNTVKSQLQRSLALLREKAGVEQGA
jgi:RNA polymerase sigma-70 factor, ECF subfamily